MKKHFRGTFLHYAKLVVGFILGSLIFSSCNYNVLENEEPEWLGSSIYDYLKTDGHFTNYTKLVEELNYTEVLAKTGSKTLFVANDSAFNEFYKKNDWGVTNYSQLSLAQKKLIMNFGMVNDAYLVEMLSNYNSGGLREGGAMRKVTAVSVLDSLPFEPGSSLPSSPYWDKYRFKGMYLLRDNTPMSIVYFTQKQLEQAQVTNEDFRIISGLTRQNNDAHIFGSKIIKRDITCKNGYLNILDRVLTPPVNMAKYVYENPKMKIFSKLLERFAAPYYDVNNTLLYKQLNPTFTDSIFVKKYFAPANLGGVISYPDGNTISPSLLLPFDPGWNSFASNPLESDMATMFVPSDEAMERFFNTGAGAILKDRFGSWDNIPTEILPLFMKRHMRTSFLSSVPSKFSKMVDVDNSVLPVKMDQIENAYIATNGLVYETNEVYPPDDYSSVYGPVLLSANDASMENKTKVWKWAIDVNDFRLYLNSMVSRYSFFVPTDEYFDHYIDPIAYAKDVQGALKYWYNTKTNSVNATVYAFNKATNEIGDSIATITSSEFLKNRLLDLLNAHIVVGGVETGKGYYLTKGNVAMKVTGSGNDMTVEAGGNIMLNEKVKVNRAYNQSNGTTYFIDRPIQAPLNSVYKVLSQEPQFSAFFELLQGFPAPTPTTPNAPVVFVNKTNYFGIDFNVKFFNTFNYTVYVPTNEAIEKAIQDTIIKPWDSKGSIEGINDITDPLRKTKEIAKLERFLRYHFQDNSVFIDGQPINNSLYQSATLKLDDAVSNFGTFKNKYYKINLNGSGGDLTLKTEANKTAHVVTSSGLYNIMTRDYVFKDQLSKYKEIDGKGTAAQADFSTSSIYTSSTAVIHQIDAVLNFK